MKNNDAWMKVVARLEAWNPRTNNNRLAKFQAIKEARALILKRGKA